MKPLAIVIPWFDQSLTGGAEQQAFQIATRLAVRGHEVEVLTTCNGSFESDWSVNDHPAGVTQQHGLTIRRFPVDARDAGAFDQVNAKLMVLDSDLLRPGVSPLASLQADTFVRENIKSTALFEHLRSEGELYHAFIFLPYMFAPVMLGAPLVAKRAWLQACLHNEPQAYLPQTAVLFRTVRGLLFNSEGEMELALRLYGPGIYSRSVVVGEGIEPGNKNTSELALALPPELRGCRFVLYLGRRDRLKNVDLLTRAFALHKATEPASMLQLVLAGPGEESFASMAGIHDLGFVSDKTKHALLAASSVLAQPSRNESFSRAMMEAWTAGRPVAVNRECLATSMAMNRACAGWALETEVEWADLFTYVASAPDDELDELGKRGQVYAREQANWETVIARYESLLELTHRQDPLRSQPHRPNLPSPNEHGHARPRLALHQLMPDIIYGDAVSNHALAIRAHLRQHGYESEIFVKRRDERMAAQAKLIDEIKPEATDGLLYHHSIGSDLTSLAVAHPGPKCLIYHNITPAKYFAQYRPGFAWMLQTGRANLKLLAPYFEVSAGVSAYNAAELAANGFHAPRVLPFIIDPDTWNIAPDEHLMERLQDGRTNLLFVGRLAPNKKQDRLIEAFSDYQKLDPESRLIIVGEGRPSDPYFHHVRNTVARFQLAANVAVTGQIDEAALLAYYRTAHLYWSASEHEGFGAPLVEAMWFDVPVFALKTSAVPETLGTSGVLYSEDEALSTVADRAYQLVHDANVRRSVIDTQRERRLDFTPRAIWPILEELIGQLADAAAAEKHQEQVLQLKL
jgi:glycosyltransferase involved in cell wall biosynthesis